MGELVNALRHFITRDLLYVVGGGSVILAFLYLFDRLPDPNSIPTAIYLLAAGIGYVLGYALQDGLSLTPLLTTSYVTEPCTFVKRLYKWFTRRDWQALDSFDPVEADVVVTAYAPDRNIAQLRRTIALKHIGTTMGSSGLVATLLLAAKAMGTTETFDITLAVSVLLVTLVLLALGWVKGAQQMQYLYKLKPIADDVAAKSRAGEGGAAA